MGLFEEAGKRFEQFKQEATAAAEEQAEFECADCGERLFAAADNCPECGAEAVVPIESDEEGSNDGTRDDGKSDHATNADGAASRDDSGSDA